MHYRDSRAIPVLRAFVKRSLLANHRRPRWPVLSRSSWLLLLPERLLTIGDSNGKEVSFLGAVGLQVSTLPWLPGCIIQPPLNGAEVCSGRPIPPPTYFPPCSGPPREYRTFLAPETPFLKGFKTRQFERSHCPVIARL